MSDSAPQNHSPARPAWLRAKLLACAKKVNTVSTASGVPVVREGERTAALEDRREWSTALDLVQEASEAVRISEERITELEAEMQELAASVAEAVRRLETELGAGEQRCAMSEERARVADARASEAEAWLERLNSAVNASFARSADPVAPAIGRS